MNNDQLYEQAEKAIDELFSDTSVSQEDALSQTTVIQGPATVRLSDEEAKLQGRRRL